MKRPCATNRHTPMTALARARLQLLGAALLFSTGGAVIKSCSLSSWQVASFRSAVAALYFVLVFPQTRRRWSGRTLLVGATYAACLSLFVIGTKLTTAANTIFLQSTAPLYVSLLAPWLLGETTSRRDLLFMGVLGGGLAMLLLGAEPASATAPNPPVGNVVGALSGVMWALTLMGLRGTAVGAARGTDPSGAAIVCGNVIAFAVCLPLALSAPAGGRLSDWLMIVYLGSVQIGAAYTLLNRAVQRVPALEAALLLLLEPVLNPLWAWVVHGERPGIWSLAGGVVILGATVAKAIAGTQSSDPGR